MKIAMVHLHVRLLDVNANVGEIKKAYDVCRDKVDLVLFPEVCLTGYIMLPQVDMTEDTIAELMHQQTRALSDLQEYCSPNTPMAIGAHTHNTYTTVNSYVLITPHGQKVVREKRSTNRSPNVLSDEYFYGGSSYSVIDVGDEKIATLICCETMDAGLVDGVLEDGVNILAHPSAYGEPMPYRDFPVLCSQQHKYDQLIVLSPNHCSSSLDGYTTYGRSYISRGNSNLFDIASPFTCVVIYDTTTESISASQVR